MDEMMGLVWETSGDKIVFPKKRTSESALIICATRSYTVGSMAGTSYLKLLRLRLSPALQNTSKNKKTYINSPLWSVCRESKPRKMDNTKAFPRTRTAWIPGTLW